MVLWKANKEAVSWEQSGSYKPTTLHNIDMYINTEYLAGRVCYLYIFRNTLQRDVHTYLTVLNEQGGISLKIA